MIIAIHVCSERRCCMGNVECSSVEYSNAFTSEQNEHNVDREFVAAKRLRGSRHSGKLFMLMRPGVGGSFYNKEQVGLCGKKAGRRKTVVPSQRQKIPRYTLIFSLIIGRPYSS